MKLSFKGYIRYLRRQHVHIQRIHAGFFAGAICAVLASFILYSQYGFWHASYSREEELVKQDLQDKTIRMESPFQSLSRLVEEGKLRFSGVTETLKPFMESEVTFDRNATTTP
jgi:hypothetical protein